ncbi:MAG: PadR family transcriptional regulator [Pseudomonadota bacterium]|jgi:DNA-binding PadR family transcriptional regulator|nr:PadR family transcriptional regulator [Xanthomonadaceae bacterium]MDE2247585.1 PadR family transcriptional regulator [Xanthomonadaceae bacterium]MDE3211103.1 PadR family transcriptional regulator [Pseudomonadota bacterium]
MTQSRTPSAQTRKLLAALTAQQAGWLHGYDLSEQTGLASGTLYPILMRLSDRGLLESKWEPSPHQGRPPRKLYRLNAEGMAYAIEHSGAGSAIWQALSPGRA